MKKLALSVAALAIAGGLMAQDPRFSLGAEIALPMGDFGEATNIGFGGSLGYEMPQGDNLGLIAQAGFLAFSGKDVESFGITVKGANSTMIPIQVGAKYYFTDNQEGFYVNALIGVHMASVDEVTGIDLTTGTFTTESKLKSNFSYAPGIGYIVGENIDLGLRYQMISGDGATSSYLGLRAAYMF